MNVARLRELLADLPGNAEIRLEGEAYDRPCAGIRLVPFKGTQHAVLGRPDGDAFTRERWALFALAAAWCFPRTVGQQVDVWADWTADPPLLHGELIETSS